MNCDPLARWYRWLEYAALGRELERRREHFLPALGGARNALVLGDGDGRFTAALLRANPLVRVNFVDMSGEMLQLARQRVPAEARERVDFQQMDAREWQAGGRRYDLIVAHFFLDCFSAIELAPVVERVAMATTPDARWIVSEFCQPERGLRAWRARIWIAGLYSLFGLTTGLDVRRLPDYAAVLAEHGFCREQVSTAQWGLLTSECWRRV